MLKQSEPVELQTDEPQEAGSQSQSFFTVMARGVVQFVLMAAILYGGFFGMNYFTSQLKETPSRPPFKTVYTVDSVVAKQGVYQPNLTVYGEVQASRQVDLRSLVAGKIVWVNPDLKVGADIKKGAELFKIDPFTFETALATAKSNHLETIARIAENEARIRIEESRIARTRDQLKLAENDLERISALKERGTATAKGVEDRALIVSQRRQTLEQSELNLVVEKNRLEQLRAILTRWEWSIAQAERDLKDTVFRAPSGGIVIEKNVAVGRLLSVNDMAVSMYDGDRLEVHATLTDQRFGRIQSDGAGVIGRPAEVIWSVGGEEYRFDAKIERISAQIESNRGGVEVIAVISDSVTESALRPGAFVEVIVPDKQFPNHFRVPETALYDNDTVYVIREGKLESRLVLIHAYDGDHAIISGNLLDGDEVLATRIAEISDGIAVKRPQKSSLETPEEQLIGKVQ
ncbi:MAG: HlyD family efflux transporter periplasmic adaptor subunit [Pseudomonadota bacterium]